MSDREPDAWQAYRNEHFSAKHGPEPWAEMAFVAPLCQVVVIVLPLAFVMMSWLLSPTFSTELSDDESIVSFMQAQNADVGMAPGEISISVRSMDRQRQPGSAVTSHQPSVPGLMHYLFLGAGLRDLAVQALIVSLLGTAVTVTLLWKLFGQPALLTVGLAAALDYSGFLAWSTSPTRIWAFVFFFGLMLAVKRDRPIWFGVLAFGLALIDYRLTAFIGVAVLVFAVLTHGWRSFLYALLLVGGPLLSIALYALEVLAFSGVDEFQREVSITGRWLVPLVTDVDPLRFAMHAWQGPIAVLGSVAQDTHNVVVFVLATGGIITSAFVLTRYQPSTDLKFLSHLTISVAVSMGVASSLLHESFVEQVTGSALPLAGFLIAPALGVVALELRTLLWRAAPWDCMGAIGAALVLVPLVLASVARYEPPFENERFREIQTIVRARTTSAPVLSEWLPLTEQSPAPDEASVPEGPLARPAETSTNSPSNRRQGD